jgi:hypothetical protein
MTAVAHQPHTPHRHIDWSSLRREYAGGTGLNLRELAELYGVPHGTVQCRAANERWRDDMPPVVTAKAVKERTRELVATTTDGKAVRIQATLIREFGADHPAIPSIKGIRAMMPRLGTHVVPEKLVPIDGLRRRCQAEGCFKLTTSDPCHHCGAKHS